MKQMTFKQKMAITVIALSTTLSAFSANLVVQQSGPSGTYGSIGAAVAAAADGDIILINNRTDALPWQEDVTINKSVTLLSAVDNVLFWVSGRYEIVQASGRVVTIVGMQNASPITNLTVSGGIPAIPARLILSQCEFSGTVDIAPINRGVRASIYATKFFKTVNVSLGEIYGSFFYKELTLFSNLSVSNDTLFLVGNKMADGLYISNNTEVLILKNNVIEIYRSSSSYLYALYCSNSPKLGSRITNCAVFCHNLLSYTNAYSIRGWNQIIENSIMNRDVSGHNSSLCYYNLSSITVLGGIANFGGTSPTTSGTLTYSDNSSTINQGNPSNGYLDLDFSRNNIGVYGGSYSIDNFHPININKSSVVNMVKIPNIVNQGQTLNLQVIATDK